MTTIALPYNLGYERLTWGLQRNVAVNRSPLSQRIQRVVRSGNLWKAAVQFPTLQAANTLNMAAFLDSVSSGGNNVFLDGFIDRQGSLATPELLTNGGFESNVNSWTLANAVQSNSAAHAWNARRLRLTNNTTTRATGTQSVTTVNALNYCLLVDLVPSYKDDGTAQLAWRINCNGAGNVDFAAATRASYVFTASGASASIVLSNNDASAGGRAQFANATLAQCLLVKGASQTGNALAFDGASGNVPNALYAGEFVTLITSTAVNSATPRYELKRLTEDVQIQSGAGVLVFEPAIRNSPADNAGIILHRGFAKCFLPKHASDYSLDGPNKAGFSVEFMEELE
jgi:hypothetical protein